MLAIVVIAALLATRGDAFGLAAGLLVAALGLSARGPRSLAAAALLASVCACIELAI